MYLRKIKVCNVNTFSYNRGTPRGALYLGNIGSPKDRCVSDTCDFFFFLGSLFRHQFHLWKPLGGSSGSVSQRPEVKIFKNEQFRLIRRFETRYGSPVHRSAQPQDGIGWNSISICICCRGLIKLLWLTLVRWLVKPGRAKTGFCGLRLRSAAVPRLRFTRSGGYGKIPVSRSAEPLNGISWNLASICICCRGII